MTKCSRLQRRARDKLERAFQASASGASIREAAKIANLPRSSYHRRMQKTDSENLGFTECRGRRPFLTTEEENNIVTAVERFADEGHCVRKCDVADAVELMVSTFPEYRRKKIPFVDNRPGRKFLTLFLKRHANRIRLGKASKEEEIRWRSGNAEVFTNHFATLEKLVADYDIDASRIANLDETGVSANRDACGRIRAKHLIRTRQSQTTQQRVATFKNVDRITLMPTIFANGDTAPPLIIIQGESIPYRVIEKENRYVVESVFDCLPRRSLLCTRKTIAGVDSTNFASWAAQFVNEIKDKTNNNRKVLLTYDGYRSHLGMKALNILQKGNVIAYCLPSHTSGKTQPLDVGVFGPFKSNISAEVLRATRTFADPTFDQFDLLHMIRQAFEKTFTTSVISSAFRKSGMWPVDSTHLLSVPRPAAYNEPNTVLSTDDLKRMMEEKRSAVRNGDCLQPVVSKRGSIDTANGLVVTSEGALRLIEAQQSAICARKKRKDLQDSRLLVRQEEERAARQASRVEFEKQALAFRVREYGDPGVLPRSLKLRRSIARERAVSKRANRHANAFLGSAFMETGRDLEQNA